MMTKAQIELAITHLVTVAETPGLNLTDAIESYDVDDKGQIIAGLIGSYRAAVAYLGEVAGIPDLVTKLNRRAGAEAALAEAEGRS